MDDADPLRLLGTGTGLRATGDRSGSSQDRSPHRVPSAALAKRLGRHDRHEGVRAYEGARGHRPDQPQALWKVSRLDDDPLLRGILRPEVDGPRRNPPFFFFQAEDGIRDLTVTGVQTCALPI